MEERGRGPMFVAFALEAAGELGCLPPPGAMVLDFGCGDGESVDELRREGYEAFGCDISLAGETDRLQLISTTPYRLPYESGSFDLVVSQQVLEHVADHEAAFREISRVLKPGAASIHVFPAKWIPIEPHVHVPLASVVRSSWWLSLWALLGVRNEFQDGRTARDVAALNGTYLRESTNYLCRSALRDAAAPFFGDVRFLDELGFMRGCRLGSRFTRAPEAVRVAVSLLYGWFRSSTLLLAAPRASADDAPV